MPEISKDSRSHAKHNKFGPNYFGYYKHAILELFSENEDFLSPAGQNPEPSLGQNTDAKIQWTSKECASPSLFCDGIGAGLSDLKKEKLKTFLKQSVIDLNNEFNEILEHVLIPNWIQAHLRVKEPSLCCSSESVKDEENHLNKKQKRSSSPQSDFNHRHIGSDGCQSAKVETGNDLHAFLRGSGLQSEEDLRESSDNFLTKLENMEQHLDEFLDIIMSKCRAMTQAEKQQLRRRIQKLPVKALDRVVQIVQHRKPSEDLSCAEIHVDLDKEEIATLWRLHYYVETAEKENRLKSS